MYTLNDIMGVHETSTSIFYTKILWGTAHKAAPHILSRFSTSDTDQGESQQDTWYDCGEIVTTQGSRQIIKKDQFWLCGATIRPHRTDQQPTSQANGGNFGEYNDKTNHPAIRFLPFDFNYSGTSWTESSIDTANAGWLNYVTVEGETADTHYFNLNHDLKLSSDPWAANPTYYSLTAKDIVATGALNAQDSVNAPIFNAKLVATPSDRRIKKNIEPLERSALDLVCQTPIYLYNFIDELDTDDKHIGMMAQDLLEKGEHLVLNIDSKGTLTDHMSIKEDKLVYILWAAVQELNWHNRDLAAKVQELERKIVLLEENIHG